MSLLNRVHAVELPNGEEALPRGVLAAEAARGPKWKKNHVRHLLGLENVQEGLEAPVQRQKIEQLQ